MSETNKKDGEMELSRDTKHPFENVFKMFDEAGDKISNILKSNQASNYMHACSASEKCKCGWTGCFCETKHDSKKTSDKVTELYTLCPKCNEIISTGIQTTT